MYTAKILYVTVVVFIVLLGVAYAVWLFHPTARLTNYVPNSAPPPVTTAGIPKQIFRTHSTLVVPRAFYQEAHESWIRLNPHYRMEWVSNEEQRAFMESFGAREYAAYQALTVGAYKCDLWRLCILFQRGGVYADSYTVLHRPLDNVLNNKLLRGFGTSPHQLISLTDRYGGIHNGFIACTAGHPMVRVAIDWICTNIETRNYGINTLDITGPTALNRAFYFASGRGGIAGRRRIGWNRPGVSPDHEWYLFEFSAAYRLPTDWDNLRHLFRLGAAVMSDGRTRFLHKKFNLWHHCYYRLKGWITSTHYGEKWANRTVFV